MKIIRFVIVVFLALPSNALVAPTHGAGPETYQRKYNTIAHQFLDWESQANEIDDNKYRALDELLESILTKVPEQLRSSATSDHTAALQVLAIVDNALATHDFVYPPTGWVDTLGDAFEPHHVTNTELFSIQFKNPNENQQAAIRANTSKVFYYMDCKTAGIIYLTVAQLLKTPLSLVDIPGHFFIRWSAAGNSFNWDTVMAVRLSDSAYVSTAHIPHNLVAAKIYLASMDDEQVRGTWHGLVGDRFADREVCDKAVQEHRKAVEMYSRSLTEKNNLAWVLSTCSDGKYRDGKEAVKIALRVVDLWPEPNFIDTLAAAYAEEHSWDEAISTEMRAKALARPELHSEFEKPWPDFDRYIDAYKQHKTYADISSHPKPATSSDVQPSTASAIPPPAPSSEVRDYLTTLQRLYADKPTLSTAAQRDAFCREWGSIMSALKVTTLAEGSRTSLTEKDAKDIVDCNKIMQYLDTIRQTPYSDPGLDFMRSHVEDRVRSAVHELGFSVKHNPTIGALPVGFLNAKVVRVPGTEDPLIIVNDEVFRLPYGISKTVMQAIDFKVVDQHYVQTLTDPDEISKYLDTHPDIVRNFEFVILEYLHQESHVLDEPVSLDTDLGYVMSQLYYGLADAVEIFIFSHEYAHLVLGHSFQRRQPLNLAGDNSSAISADETVYSWKQELEADAYGFLILDSVLKHDAIARGKGDWQADPLYPFFVSAPSFFFLSMELVERSKTILETGKATPSLSKQDIALARRAVDQLFSDAQTSAQNVKAGQDESANSHPPFVIRFVEASVLADKAQSLFFENSKLPAGTAQVYRLGKLFQETLLMLSDRTDPLFEQRYQDTENRPAKSSAKTSELASKNRVSPNELSPALVNQELKERGVDVLDPTRAAPLKDAFVKYDYLAGDSTNLVSESPSVFKAAKQLAKTLGDTGLRSKVKVITKTAGARVHFQLIGLQNDTVSSRLTNNTDDELPIGFYHIWTERQGVRTSSKTNIFRILKAEAIVDIEEMDTAAK